MIVYGRCEVYDNRYTYLANRPVVLRNDYFIPPHSFEESLNFFYSYMIAGMVRAKGTTYNLTVF